MLVTAPSSDRPPKAIILAAGRGERMRPLSDATPKPLLKVRGKPLIEWHLEALARGGVREVVVNTAWLEEQIVAALGDGSRFGLAIRYSLEGRDHGGALETAGGIAKALPLLAERPGDVFWVISGDIHAPDFDFGTNAAERLRDAGRLAHLWLVANPPYHPQGDFGLSVEGLGLADAPGPDGRRWTYANIALCRAALCAEVAVGTRVPLGPLLYAGMRERRISVEVYEGRWANVGTPEELAALLDDDPITARPVEPDARRIRGLLKSPHAAPLTVEQEDEAVSRHLREKHAGAAGRRKTPGR